MHLFYEATNYRVAFQMLLGNLLSAREFSANHGTTLESLLGNLALLGTDILRLLTQPTKTAAFPALLANSKPSNDRCVNHREAT